MLRDVATDILAEAPLLAPAREWIAARSQPAPPSQAPSSSPPSPPPALKRMKALAREKKPQLAVGLEKIVREHVDETEIVAFLRAQNESLRYGDVTARSALGEFLRERSGECPRRALEYFFGSVDLKKIARALNAADDGGAGAGAKADTIAAILLALGYRPPASLEGVATLRTQLDAATKALKREADRARLIGLGIDVFKTLERALKDLVHFYGTRAFGAEYLDTLRERGWVGPHSRGVASLPLGALRTSFQAIVGELRAFAIPAPMTKRLENVVGVRNKVFGHDTPELRSLNERDIRDHALAAAGAASDLLDLVERAGAYPRRIILDRTAQDRHGELTFECVTEGDERVVVYSGAGGDAGGDAADSRGLEPGRTYFALTISDGLLRVDALVAADA